jgi:mannose-6-phosphate isomerase-like protein (cupin superfamily)
MESINGCTVIRPGRADVARFDADITNAYVAEIGSFPPGQPGPPVHVHPNTDEGFYIAEGEAAFLLGGHELPVSAGGFVFVPRGTEHTVWNSGHVPVRGLIIISPGDAVHEFLPVGVGPAQD